MLSPCSSSERDFCSLFGALRWSQETCMRVKSKLQLQRRHCTVVVLQPLQPPAHQSGDQARPGTVVALSGHASAPQQLHGVPRVSPMRKLKWPCRRNWSKTAQHCRIPVCWPKLLAVRFGWMIRDDPQLVISSGLPALPTMSPCSMERPEKRPH